MNECAKKYTYENMKFKYWNNKISVHGELLFEIDTESITEADKKFKEKTKIDAIKNSWVGLEILVSQK